MITTGENKQRPKLRKVDSAPQEGNPPASPTFFLPVSGLVVHKDQLVAALKPFIPNLADIQPFEDGECFLFVFSPDNNQQQAHDS